MIKHPSSPFFLDKQLHAEILKNSQSFKTKGLCSPPQHISISIVVMLGFLPSGYYTISFSN